MKNDKTVLHSAFDTITSFKRAFSKIIGTSSSSEMPGKLRFVFKVLSSKKPSFSFGWLWFYHFYQTLWSFAILQLYFALDHKVKGADNDEDQDCLDKIHVF